MRFSVLAVGLGLLTLSNVGCGGGDRIRGSAKSPASGAAETAEAYDAPAQPSFPQAAPPSAAKSSAGAPAAEPMPGTASRQERSADSSSAPSPKQRPGLGTEWGETRNSRIREVAFERQGGDPTSVVALHYNDREGARALASFRDARPLPTTGVTALGGAVRVTLEDDGGGSLQAFRMGERTVVVGTAGQRYSIVLTNRTGRRFEAVASVDGLDVISGRSASFDQRGYVLLPFATLRIEGFRQSERAVAAFRFSRVAESYAAQTGSARNVGVIGLALFRERGDTGVSEGELELRDSATPFPSEPSRFAQPPR